MLNTSSIRPLQEQFGRELVAKLAQNIEAADLETADLEAALLDASHQLSRDLQTVVMLTVDAGRSAARQIVVMALENVLRKRRGEAKMGGSMIANRFLAGFGQDHPLCAAGAAGVGAGIPRVAVSSGAPARVTGERGEGGVQAAPEGALQWAGGGRGGARPAGAQGQHGGAGGVQSDGAV